jgi:RNA polymerase sigma-70 factor (ECF subfamily)
MTETDQRRAKEDVAIFEPLRAELVALAYRMLGDVARAHEMVQETWLRWHDRKVVVESPRAFLVTILTRLCLSELTAARTRHEESRGDRLPEPVALAEGGMDRLESLEQVSMAFLVVLERLTPAERAVLLLHDAFDFTHDEIAPLVGRTPVACRKLLERARQHVAAGRRMITARRDEHARLLQAFVRATTDGDLAALVELLARDAVLITDGGAGGRTVGSIRNLQTPLVGAERIAAFLAAVGKGGGLVLEREERELNGQPAVVFFHEGKPFGALLLGVADGRIQRVFFQGDPARLRYLGSPPSHS